MNDDETQNESLCESPPRFYHDKPSLELQTFANISSTNFDAMEEKLHSITIDENIWDEIISYKELSDKLTEDIKLYSVNTALIDGEIEYYKRKIRSRGEEIADITQLIQECVCTLKQLENEKSEFTDNLIKKHQAIKQATKYYKKRLNIHISLENKNQTDFCKICLFTQEDKDQFSIIISISENMKLEKIKPQIPEIQFNQIQKKFHDEQNICALVCEMRKLFLTYK